MFFSVVFKLERANILASLGKPIASYKSKTMALNKATLPLLIKLADQGYKKTLQENKNYLAGLNVYKGKITFKGVAEAFKLNYTPAEKALLE